MQTDPVRLFAQLAPQFANPPLGDQAPLVDQRNAIDDCLQLVQHMTADQHAQTLASKSLDLLCEFMASNRVEPGHRFVQQ